MKKRLVLFLVAVVATMTAMAQVPQTFTYQAVVRDANGRLISNGNIGVKVSILQGSETGAVVYQDEQTARTNANGLFTIEIGNEQNSIAAIDWARGPYFLKSEVDPTGGDNYVLSTVQQMLSVPYALRAYTVDSIVGGVNYNESDPVFTAWNKDYNDLINRPNLADSVSRIVNEYHLGDTIINYISQNGYIDSNYVINYNTQQGYVDTSYVTNYISNGGAVTSESDPVFTAWDKDYNDLINLPAIPTAVSELANDAGYLTSYTEVQSLGDVTTIGNAANSQLKEVSDPTEDLDAVNLRTLNLTINDVVADWTHRFDSITHRYDSIIHSVDSIIAYQDSVIDTLTQQLVILGTTTGDTTAVACDIFNWYGTEYTVSGDYQHRLTNAAGFDSILTMHLTINHGTHNTESQTACDSYTWHGNDYTASGTYTHDYTNGVGCASTDTLQLTIVLSTHNVENQTACNDYTWHGNDYATTGVYTYDYTNGMGCASTDTLQLTIELSTHSVENQTACNDYMWHGNDYTASGTYTYDYTNGVGCASTDTLQLTIELSTHNAENQTACDSYTWHGNDYTAGGTYTYDYTNGVGCASTDTLHLTINSSTAATASHTECDSYTWIDGNTYTVSNSTATHTLTNTVGCDSVVTLNLTVNHGTHNSTTQTATSSYTWHGTTYAVSGNYTYSYTNAAGCASVDTLHLTIGGFDENGASNALFSVSSTKKIRFSRGNLQFKTTGTHTVTGGGTSSGTWRFAEHQYDCIGDANRYISSSYTGWIDLFGWGTSGWSGGVSAYQPWATSTSSSAYYPGGSSSNSLTGTYARADWGVYNAISNGGNQPGMWRTMTKDEWSYLFSTRNASTVGGTANARYAKATVNGTIGVIIFPDTFILPAGLTVTNVNTSSSSFESNTYTTSQWSLLEASGCIFLPNGGSRWSSSTVSSNGCLYWSSTYRDDDTVWGTNFRYDNSVFSINYHLYRQYAYSVRLVKEAN